MHKMHRGVMFELFSIRISPPQRLIFSLMAGKWCFIIGGVFKNGSSHHNSGLSLNPELSLEYEYV